MRIHLEFCRTLVDYHHMIRKGMSMCVRKPEEKTNNLGSDQVRHKPACTVTEACKKLEISDLSRRGIILSV